MSMQLPESVYSLWAFICVQCTCVAHILHLSICAWPQKDGRWQIGPAVRKTPLRVTPGPGSDVTTTSAADSSRRPGALVCPVRGSADLLPRATVEACEKEKWAQRRTMTAAGFRDDRGDNSILLTAEIAPLLSCSYIIPPKHLIFAQLLICACLFMSSLFTFTCRCWDYLALQATRFLLLKQLLCSVCFEHRKDSIKKSLNILYLVHL